MDRPLCKLCGAKHWPSEPHKFAKGDGTDKPPSPGSVASSAGIPRSQTPPAPVAPEAHDNLALADHEGGAANPVAPGEVCPTCGKRMGLTGAERQRQHRAKARE